MSVLESLYILVKLETDQLKKGLDDTKSQVKSLENEFEKLGRAGDTVQHSFDNVLKSAVGLFAGFASFHALLSGASGAIASIREVGKAARELNVDVSALDAWGSAVERIGGSASGFQSSLSSLASHFGTTNDIALKALPKLAETFNKLNPLQAKNYGKSLGLDQSTILFLQQGRREVEATITQQKQLGTVTREQAETTRKFDAALYDATRAYQNFYKELVTPILPSFTKALNWSINHKDFVKDAFVTMAAGVGVLSLALIRLNPTLAIAVGALTAISGIRAFSKDEARNYKAGNPSLLGVIEELPLKLGAKAVKLLGYGGEGSSIFDKAIIGGLAGQPLTQNSFARNGPGPVTVNIGDVTVNTAATDGHGVVSAFIDKLAISQLISQVDNGVHK